MQDSQAAAVAVTKKRQIIKKGVQYSEINEFLARLLAEDGYAGVEIRPSDDMKTQIVIKCTSTLEIVKRIPALQRLIQLRFRNQSMKLFAEKVSAKGLSARAQAQSICFKLKGGLAVRRACWGVLKYIKDNGKAKGVSIVISGKLRGQRAKAMKFSDGYMISSGNAVRDYIVEAVEHVMLRQGTIGVRVTIMLPYDPEQKFGGCPKLLPDIVTINEPQEEKDLEQDFAGNFQQQDNMEQQPQQYQQTQGQEQQQYQQQDQYQTPGGPQDFQQQPPPQQQQQYQQEQPQQDFRQQQPQQQQYQTPY